MTGAGARRAHRRLFGPDRFGSITLLALAMILVTLAGDRHRVGIVGWALVSGSLLVLATSTAVPGTRAWRRALVVASVAVAAAVVASATESGTWYRIAMVSLALLTFATVEVIMRRVLTHQRVQIDTLLGAICAYVLIGTAFAFAFDAVGGIDGTGFVAGGRAHGIADHLYLSYITLATVGYGDLAPAAGWPRGLAVIEGLMGQIFLVTLVARLVSMFGSERRPTTIAGDGGTPSEGAAPPADAQTARRSRAPVSEDG